ncbi:AMP-binding protein [Streptomyces antibioticus]|uniref:AMP-binding protein n=1 Tax=Streptomyces antibioticus TaxID=1890 RepID=UPI00224DD8B5|nr:AMP-binding protein [Streptomyces antibioticus]MCX4743038.1 AMP-binding protein [Streptomyces antibioticus]
MNGQTIHSLLDAAVQEAPDAPAIRDATGRWTYRELAAAAGAFARWLRGQGIGRGDRVVVQLATSRELAAMFYGTSRVGAVFVPLNPAMKEFHLRSVVGNAEPKLVLTDAAGAAVLRRVSTAPVHDIADVRPDLAPAGENGGEPEAVAPDDLAVLIYTSGSTAAPKAVMCPHAQVTFACRALTEVLGYRPDDVVFCRFPMSWDYGLCKVLMTCVARCEIVLADGESDLLLLRRMRETGVTVVPIVPSLATMIVRLAGRDTGPVPPVRMFTNTGAALPQSTIDALRTRFPGARVVRQYGQTEAKRITVMPPEADRERPDAVGLPLPGTRVLILDDDGNPLPASEVGEIVAGGPHVMAGYWRNPEDTARAFRRDLHAGEPLLHTGDYGWLDEDGYLYFQGRRDDMFKHKGLRMSTLEIESAAMDIPGVRAAAALPPGDGHGLALFVESDLEAHQVITELTKRLELPKVPTVCRVLKEFPLTLHGKNARRELAALLEGSGA